MAKAGRRESPVNPLQGERLKEIISENGLTQKKLAESLGVIGDKSISAYCNNYTNIPNDIARAIGSLLNVNPDWLMCIDGASKRPPEYDRLYNDLLRELNVHQAFDLLFASMGYEISTDKSGAYIKHGNETAFLTFEKYNSMFFSIRDSVNGIITGFVNRNEVNKLENEFEALKGVENDGTK